MSKRGRLKREIEDCEREIEALEAKRERSQIAVMRAMLAGQKPDPQEEQYFIAFSNLIDQEREHLRSLYAELDEMKKRKK